VAAPTPAASATTAPLPSLEEVWARLKLYHVVWSIDQLRLVPPLYRNDPYFGINNALVPNDATAPLMRGMGATTDRIEARWDVIEPAPGVYRFDDLDRLVDEGARWNFAIVLVVDGAPAWAVSAPQYVGAGPPAKLGEPALQPDGTPNPRSPWSQFVGALAARYGQRIGTWEIWNEPNFRDFWHGSADDYAMLFRVARQSIRAADPTASVILAGLVVDDGSFLRAVVHDLCPKGDCANPPFDGVAWHVYTDPTNVLNVAQITRSILAPYHFDVPIWVTEGNAAVDDPQAPADALVGPDSVSLAEQAAFVLQLYALSRVADVRTVMIYRALDVDEERHYWGLFRAYWSARPAALAYSTAARWLSNVTDAQLSHPLPGVTEVDLLRSNERVRVFWNSSSASQSVDVKVSGPAAKLIDANGQETSPPIRSNLADLTVKVTLSAAPPHPASRPTLGTPVILVDGSR
jgi:hypothetical protein